MNSPTELTEFRKDGWPFCPACGDDEVMSFLSDAYILTYHDEHGTLPPLADYLDAPLRCIACGWERPERFVGRIGQDSGR